MFGKFNNSAFSLTKIGTQIETLKKGGFKGDKNYRTICSVADYKNQQFVFIFHDNPNRSFECRTIFSNNNETTDKLIEESKCTEMPGIVTSYNFTKGILDDKGVCHGIDYFYRDYNTRMVFANEKTLYYFEGNNLAFSLSFKALFECVAGSLSVMYICGSFIVFFILFIVLVYK